MVRVLIERKCFRIKVKGIRGDFDDDTAKMGRTRSTTRFTM